MQWNTFFTSSFPFINTAGILKVMQSCWQVIQKRGYIVPEEEWDREYKSGEWDYLYSLPETSRYFVIASYYDFCRPNGDILDIGCGEGLLQRNLKKLGYNYYLGIDVSSQAIHKAKKHEDPTTQFICAEGAAYVPPRLFDAIVFNESIYYFDRPLEVFKRYMQYLRPGGVCIVSTCVSHSPHGRAITGQLKQSYRCLDKTLLKNDTAAWEILLLSVDNH